MLKPIHFLRKNIFFNTFLVVFIVFCSTNIEAQNKQPSVFGEKFEVAKQDKKAKELFGTIALSDSIQTQLSGEIMEVCQMKGCWMNVQLEEGAEVFVRFKDYGFFVPTNSVGSTVFMNGKAFVEEMSVEDQKHYAMDSGASQEEIDKITQPKRVYRFEADGVLIED